MTTAKKKKPTKSTRRPADLEVWHEAQKRHPLVRFLAGRGYWNGRDLRGHFARLEDVEEPCPHRCCAGRPAGKRPRVPTPHVAVAGPRESADARRKRQRFSDAVDYDGYLHAHYLAAEEATRGNMVSRAGRARGYGGADFFKPGRRPSVEKWGSEELKAWFRSGNAAASSRRGPAAGVLSFTEYRQQTRERAA